MTAEARLRQIERCVWPSCTCPGEVQCPVIEQEYSAFRGAAVANRTRCYEDLRELREENAELRRQLAAARSAITENAVAATLRRSAACRRT